jgi:peptidoglycan/LPS O-acetylase OafA/YrhL
MPPKTSLKIDQLTGLRFFAALLVFCSHLKWDKAAPSLDVLFTQGYVGVSFFFVLSGFVLSYSYADKLTSGRLGKVKYMLLRCARLSPLHVLTAAPFIWIAASHHRLDPAGTLANLLFLHSWIPSSNFYFSLNAPSWSLSDEMFFYASFAVLAFLSFKARVKLWAALMLTVLSSAFIVEAFFSHLRIAGEHNLAHWLFYIFPGFRILEFLTGMLLFDFWRAGKLANIQGTWLAIPLLLVAMYWGSHIPESLRVSLYYLPFVTFLLASHLTARPTLSSRFFSARLMVLLGEASFAFYMIHQPLIRLAREAMPDLAAQQLTFAICLLTGLAVLATLIFVVYERPAERQLKQLILGRVAPTSQAPGGH